MKLNKLFSAIGLGLLMVSTVACGEETPTTPTPTTTTTIELKFKTAVVASTENEGELRIKAEINGTVGKLYAILTETECSPTAAQVIAGKSFDNVVVVKALDSGNDTKIEQIVNGLDAGKEYYAYFVISYEGTNSAVLSKMAMTYKSPIDMGEGTPESPFKIRTVEDLAAIGLGVYETYGLQFSKNSCYVLENDIDLSTYCGESLGNWTPINLDNGGVLDGAGHTISGVYINNTASSTSLGLFERINVGATVKDLNLENVTIISNGYVEQGKIDGTSVGTSGGIFVGALSGDLKGQVSNVKVNNVNIQSTGSRVGGLVGRAYSDNGTAIVVENCQVTNATISGVSRLGGIAGLVDCKDNTVFETPLFKNVVFQGTITGRTDTFEHEGQTATVDGQYVGGIAGYFRAAMIKNASTDVTITAKNHAGGVVGFMQKRSKTSEVETSLENVIVKANINTETGSNCGLVVGNKSANNNPTPENTFVNNVWYSELSTVSVAGESKVIAEFAFNVNSIVGTVVPTLNQEFYTTNLPTFDFENIFKLTEQNLPILK